MAFCDKLGCIHSSLLFLVVLGRAVAIPNLMHLDRMFSMAGVSGTTVTISKERMVNLWSSPQSLLWRRSHTVHSRQRVSGV